MTNITVSAIKTVGVIGAGTMGNGIAQSFAQSGFSVILADQKFEFAEKGLAKIKEGLSKFVEKGKLSSKDMDKALAAITLSSEFKDLTTADLIIEAVNEDWTIKENVWRKLDSICSSHTIFASNTSSIPITKLASATNRAVQFIGMHFMNPVPLMKLVEVIRGYHTSDAVVTCIVELAKALGKTAVESNDFPGFISNRILMPMINEAIFALQERVGTKEAIDAVMKLGMNHPMGPLELADFIGLDTCLSILNVLFEGFKDPKYRPAPLLVQMVLAKTLGKKTGQGFYKYS